MTTGPGRVLILGADGFIGRHLAFGLRAKGWQVLASARRTSRLRQMGFETLEVDLAKADAGHPEFWWQQLQGVTHVVNVAGVLSASEAIRTAVHVTTPEAIYSALPEGAPASGQRQFCLCAAAYMPLTSGTYRAARDQRMR